MTALWICCLHEQHGRGDSRASATCRRKSSSSAAAAAAVAAAAAAESAAAAQPARHASSSSNSQQACQRSRGDRGSAGCAPRELGVLRMRLALHQLDQVVHILCLLHMWISIKWQRSGSAPKSLSGNR